jgi:hypothetical protein
MAFMTSSGSLTKVDDGKPQVPLKIRYVTTRLRSIKFPDVHSCHLLFCLTQCFSNVFAQGTVRGATQKFPKFECRAKTACSTVVGL